MGLISILRFRRASTSKGQLGNFVDSGSYWEERYKSGGNSGAGSYGILAEYKANFLNEFVSNRNIRSVLDFGCGDGNNSRFFRFQTYLGLDVSETAIAKAKSLFLNESRMAFLVTPLNGLTLKADLVLSLDVIYHLIEDDVYVRYLQDLTACTEKYLIVYSSNTNEEHPASHIKHRVFTDWLRINRPDFALIEYSQNPFPDSIQRGGGDLSFANFYVFERLTI